MAQVQWTTITLVNKPHANQYIVAFGHCALLTEATKSPFHYSRAVLHVAEVHLLTQQDVLLGFILIAIRSTAS